MGILEIIIIGTILALDAFAISIYEGISMKKMNYKNTIIIAFYFGIFQAIMLVIGYLLGSAFSDFVASVDHWIAFILLVIIGGKMIKDSTDHKKKKKKNSKVDAKAMILLAAATSIDALAIGVTFGFLEINIFLAATIVGTITFLLSMAGVKIGNKFGNKLQNKAELIGGIILIIIGLKILLEHLGILPF